MFRLLLVAVLAALLPAMARSEPRQEMQESAFLDLVEVEGHVLVQGSGVEAVNTKARSQVSASRHWATGLRKATAS